MKTLWLLLKRFLLFLFFNKVKPKIKISRQSVIPKVEETFGNSRIPKHNNRKKTKGRRTQTVHMPDGSNRVIFHSIN